MATAVDLAAPPPAPALSPTTSPTAGGRPRLLWFTCAVVLLDNLGFSGAVAIGPVTLYLLDFATLLFAIYAMRHLGRILQGGLPLLALLLCLCCTVAWIRGAVLVHPVTAGNAIRLSAWFAAALLAGCLTRYRPADCSPPLVVTVIILVAIAIGRWLHLVPYPGDVELYYSAGGMLRPLTAFGAAALFLACAVTLLCDRRQWWLFLLAGPILVLLQHRSVWVMMAIYVCWLGVDRLRRSAVTSQDILAACLLLIATICVFVLPTPLADSLHLSASEMSATSGTGGWRVETNLSLIGNFPSRPFTDQMLGLPAGAAWELEVNNRTTTVNPHTMYLATLLHLGLIGLTVLVAILALCVRHTWRARGQADAIAIVAAVLGYGLVYGFSYFIGFILGLLAVGIAETARQTEGGNTYA